VGKNSALNIQKFAEFYTEMCLQEHSFLQYDSFTLACGVIMAARKMMKLKEKWPNELYLMTGQRKKANQIKRCMNHIFEFYEETFPEQSIKAFDSLSTSAGDDKSAAKSKIG
jgi:Cyclin, C-terminal domain